MTAIDEKHNDPSEFISSHCVVVAYKQLSPAFERFYMINEVASSNFLLFYGVFTGCCFKKEKYFCLCSAKVVKKMYNITIIEKYEDKQ